MIDNLIVIPGAPKSGTTSLYNTLSLQPFIKESSIKEPHFFSLDDKTIYNNLDWYERYYGHKEKWNIDASTTYLYTDEAIHHIKNYIKNPKIIIILRDPAKRIFSQYQHLRKKTPKSLDLRSLDYIVKNIHGGNYNNIIESEKKLINKSINNKYIKANYYNEDYLQKVNNAPFNSYFRDKMLIYKYFCCSLYSLFVPRFLEVFPKNSKVIFFEDFKENPSYKIKEILDFLGISISLDKVNVSEKRYTTLVPTNHFTRMIWHMRTKKIIPDWLISILKNIGFNKTLLSMKQSALIKPELNKELYYNIRSKLDFEYDYWLDNYPHLRNSWDY